MYIFSTENVKINQKYYIGKLLKVFKNKNIKLL